jgi:Ca-activated chloride channel family protein
MVFMGKVVFIILLLTASLTSFSQEDQQIVVQGNQLYKNKQYDKAAEQYLKATDLNVKNQKAFYNLGNSLYRSNKTEGAQKAYDAAAETTKDPTSKSRALYNKGVTLSSQKKLEESIQAYKQTLRLNSTDEQARQNLQKALNELKKQPPQQKPKDDKSDKNKQDKKKDDPDKNNSKLNKKQVDQMLNALRQEEKKLQQNIQQRNNTGGSNSKDW